MGRTAILLIAPGTRVLGVTVVWNLLGFEPQPLHLLAMWSSAHSFISLVVFGPARSLPCSGSLKGQRKVPAGETFAAGRSGRRPLYLQTTVTLFLQPPSPQVDFSKSQSSLLPGLEAQSR